MVYYSVVNLLRIVTHYSKCSKTLQKVVIHYIVGSESLCVANSLQIVNSLRILFLVCQCPLRRGVEFKGGSLLHGFGGFDGFAGSGDSVGSTLPSFCRSYNTGQTGKHNGFDGFGGYGRFDRDSYPPLNSSPLFRHPETCPTSGLWPKLHLL